MKHFIASLNLSTLTLSAFGLSVLGLTVLGLSALAACSAQTQPETAAETAPKAAANSDAKTDTSKMDHSKIVTGNGKNNYVILEGATRNAQTFTFPQVTLDKDGFLVMHPFKDGKPVQTEYVGAVPVAAGTHKDVSLTINTPTQTGDNFIVMLHYDMNRDKIFDFNDGITVPDAPVFEGHTLVALRYTAP